MAPSPAMRYSPGREPREDKCKRGRSLENGIRIKQRDDDLALFNEVQSREKDNFLLQGNDDFEDIFANKLRNFSDYKLGINIPARGESSDLLHTEEEKNDYEWLITPPDTPLFASLDDEVPQVNFPQRGRPRTQPISISRSSTMEKSHRSSKGSASPNRISLSPRSNNNTFEGRYRATSAPSASPPTLKPTATSLKSSSPPSRKPSTPPQRSSPVSNSTPTSRGNSGISPKVKAWQSTIPGFSTEVPPNLRTSLADRPASYVRGSSPASRGSRQSMSPTASRSIGSSRGSVGSSADDEVESFSSSVGNSKQRVNSRRVSGFQNNRGSVSSKKPSRTVSSSSAPKRSFDLALRQMDHRKGPQNMFRPLLSSVPTSTFHAGISSSHHTMNSSVTTSSNASSGLGNVGAHDPETSQDDAISGFVKIQDDNVISDEVFVIEKDDSFDGSRNITNYDPTTLNASSFEDISEINSQKETGLSICSKCGYRYLVTGLETENNVCRDCLELNSPLTIIDPVGPTTVVEVKVQSGQHDDIVKGSQSTYNEPIWNFLSENSLSQSQSEECETKKVNHETPDFSKSKVESLEGSGISILLRKSTSLKGAVLRNTSFTASSISYDDFSYVRGSTNSMRSVSASSSVDFGVNKQMDTRFQRQSSGTKSEIENYTYHVKDFHPSSLSGKQGQENNEENDAFTPENHTYADSEEPLSNECLKDEEFQKAVDSEPHDVVEVPLDAISKGEFDETGQFSSTLNYEVELSSTGSIEELQEDVAVSVEDHDNFYHINNVIEESVVLVSPDGGLKGRSLTLEEATDTILFCRSIVQNLAHSAATIAIEKENSTSPNNHAPWPLIPTTRKPDLYKPEFQIPNTAERSSKPQKSRQRKEAETDTAKAIDSQTEGKVDQPKTRIVGARDLSNGESKKPPVLESKCNCTIM